MYLGVKAVIALAIERIHAANLINFGILPFIFEQPSDYDRIRENDAITIAGAVQQLAVGKPVVATVKKVSGEEFTITLRHNLSAEDIKIVIAGGILNCV
jgi:aconitate hydratase